MLLTAFCLSDRTWQKQSLTRSLLWCHLPAANVNRMLCRQSGRLAARMRLAERQTWRMFMVSFQQSCRRVRECRHTCQLKGLYSPQARIRAALSGPVECGSPQTPWLLSCNTTFKKNAGHIAGGQQSAGWRSHRQSERQHAGRPPGQEECLPG